MIDVDDKTVPRRPVKREMAAESVERPKRPEATADAIVKIPGGRLTELRAAAESITETHKRLGEVTERRVAMQRHEEELCSRLLTLRTEFDRLEALASEDSGIKNPATSTLDLEAGGYRVIAEDLSTVS